VSKRRSLYTMGPVKAGKKFFNMGRDASRRAAKTGGIPCIKIGGRYFASIPAIEALLANAGKVKPDTS
jgi:hypothetical protein